MRISYDELVRRLTMLATEYDRWRAQHGREPGQPKPQPEASVDEVRHQDQMAEKWGGA